MKATGIIRRIDDLGRVVIPKEIRQRFGIREGDALDIFTSDEGITLSKHDTTPDKEKEAQELLAKYAKQMKDMYARFTIEGDTTVCECIFNGERHVGTAKRNPSDSFSPSIGMIYAFSRAANIKIMSDIL